MCYRLYIINFSLSCKINTHTHHLVCFALSFSSHSHSLDSFSVACCWSWCQEKKAVIFIPIDWLNLFSLNFLQTLKCFCEHLLLGFLSVYFGSKIYQHIHSVALPMQNCETVKCDKLHWQAANRCCYSGNLHPFSSNRQTRIRASKPKLSKQLPNRCLSQWIIFFRLLFLSLFRGEKSHSKLIFVRQSISNTHDSDNGIAFK